MTRRTALWVAGIVALVAVLLASLGAAGLRFYTVMTPSMGTTAPVGTLVITQPAATYVLGDIVTYAHDRRSITHRIVEVKPDGSFVTKGDLNAAADPLPVSTAEVVGRAVLLAPSLGWLLQGLPWLGLGFLLVLLLSFLRPLEHPWEWVFRISGWTLVLCLVAFWLHPWVSLSQLAWSPSEQGGVDMHVVNTGLFPLDALGERLVSGQDAMVHVTEQNSRGEYTLSPALAFYWWEQVGLFLICLIPLALSLLIRDDRPTEPARAIGDVPEPDTESETETLESLVTHQESPVVEPATVGATTSATLVLTAAALVDVRARAEGESKDQAERSEGRRRLILIGAIVLSIIISVAVVTFTTTSAGLTASVTNSTNTAGTRLTCRGALAIASAKANDSFFAFALEPTGVTARTEKDLAGKPNGTYRVTPVSSTSVGCTQDKPLTSVTFTSGSAQCLSSPTAISNAPTQFTLEAWFRTNATSAPNAGFGKIMGFGASANSPIESTYDRHLYINSAGRVVFGTYDNNNTYQTVMSGTSKADMNWHHVMATFSPTTGMILYIDGAEADRDTSYTTAENTTGYWKIGCGNLNGWPSPGGSTSTSGSVTYRAGYFNGYIQYAAAYTTVLPPSQVQAHYRAGLP